MIIPIPSSKAKRISDGHSKLCDYLSKRLNIENGTGILQRKCSIKSSHLSKRRATSDRQYITITCKGNVSNKNILLFDDIYTTGNTARACIERLVRSDAKYITLITLGRTV